MIWSNLIQRTTFLLLTGSGLLGNALVFARHTCSFVMGAEKRSLHAILSHLALANTIVILCTGTRDILTAFHLRNFAGDAGCKAMIYLERVARGLSICTTSLLSMAQVATVSPRTILWQKLKPQTAWHVLLCFLLLWIFNVVVSSNLLHYIRAGSSVNGSGEEMSMVPCYMMPSRRAVRWLFLSLMALRDVTFQGLMGWSSGSMAFRLYQHHKRVLYLRSSRPVSSSSPEIRATLSILILMACFLFFYWADFIFSFYTGYTVTHNSTVLNIKQFLVLSYAGLSPFILIIRDMRVTISCGAH